MAYDLSKVTDYRELRDHIFYLDVNSEEVMEIMRSDEIFPIMLLINYKPLNWFYFLLWYEDVSITFYEAVFRYIHQYADKNIANKEQLQTIAQLSSIICSALEKRPEMDIKKLELMKQKVIRRFRGNEEITYLFS